MYEQHHRETESHGGQGARGDDYRKNQKKLIDAGRYDAALDSDVQNMQNVAPGLYDLSINQMLKKMQKRGIK
jgi:hypothetical protein